MENYQNYENAELTVTGTVICCNITRCILHNTDATFDRCNITECVFDNPAAFIKSNVYYRTDAPLPDGCTFDRSNLTNLDEIEEDEE